MTVFFKPETIDGEEYIVPSKIRNTYHSERYTTLIFSIISLAPFNTYKNDRKIFK